MVTNISSTETRTIGFNSGILGSLPVRSDPEIFDVECTFTDTFAENTGVQAITRVPQEVHLAWPVPLGGKFQKTLQFLAFFLECSGFLPHRRLPGGDFFPKAGWVFRH